jgi:hypothetical protein
MIATEYLKVLPLLYIVAPDGVVEQSSEVVFRFLACEK